MIGVCTDATAQLPAVLAQRLAIGVVPVAVTLDGEEFELGPDMDADGWWERRQRAAQASVVHAPRASRFAEAYATLAAAGAQQVVSVHSSRDQVPGVLEAARAAAAGAPVPVVVAAVRSAWFGMGACAWEAAVAARDHATRKEVVEVAQTLPATLAGVWSDAGQLGGDGGAPVTAWPGGDSRPLPRARSLEEAAERMTGFIRLWGTGLRVAVGHAAREAQALADATALSLDGQVEVREVVRFRIGPGSHAAPGSVAVWCYPTATP